MLLDAKGDLVSQLVRHLVHRLLTVSKRQIPDPAHNQDQLEDKRDDQQGP